jgi:chorismate mutase
MARVRGIRGATTADSNTREAILQATKELLGSLVDANGTDPDDVAAAFFTTTDDLNAEFPAVAARQMGWEYVARMCGHEMRVPGAPAQCIRVLLLINTDKAPQDLKNVYLRGATELRNRGVEEV